MTLIKLLLIGSVTFVFLGCSGSEEPTPEEQKQAQKEKIDELSNAPFWLKDPSSLDGLSAIGQAMKTTGGSNLQQTEAIAMGRDNLRKLIGEKVSKTVNSGLLKMLDEADRDDFKPEEILEIAKNIGSHVSLSVISGSKKKAIWFDPKEKMYLLMSADENVVKKLTLDGTRMVLRSKGELFQIYRNNNGRVILKEYLDKYIYN